MPDWLKSLESLAPIGAVVVFAWGVYQFYRSTELGFRKPYWEKLLSLYIEACSSAATLARTDNPQEWSQARNVFWRMYFGPLCLVEDLRVEGAMVEFGNALEPLTFESPERKQLEKLSLRLASACRDSIRADWRVPLEVLTGKQSRVT